MENTTDMKSPLLSKYCCLENNAQFLAATSLMFSEKYTSNTGINQNYRYYIKDAKKSFFVPIYVLTMQLIIIHIFYTLCKEQNKIIEFVSARKNAIQTACINK